jgi:hypothetical protein
MVPTTGGGQFFVAQCGSSSNSNPTMALKEETMLTAQNKTDLATALENRNPYSFLNAMAANQGMELQTGWDSQIEHDSYEIGYWKFKDRSLRVVKAIRIPYTYQDKNGNKIKEYILIGFEGAGGD